jgi:tetratricopeptide (TPR) repeat protein
MRQKILLLLTFINFINVHSQKLNGTWILEKTVYENGNPLEINHTLYSTFTKYDFLTNSIKINDQKFNAKYANNSIKLDFRELLFSFDNNYLLIQEKGDDKIQILSKKEDFLSKNIEFKSEIEIRNLDTLYIRNEVYKPQFNNELTFEDFLRKNISKYRSESTKNNLFKSEFVLTKDGKIKDIKILRGISKSFDTEFIIALNKAEPYFKNDTGKDFLIKHNFNFFQMFKGVTEKIEKEFYAIQKKGNLHFENNEFDKAIIEYEKLNIMDLNSIEERLGFLYSEAFTNLGISYLAVNKNDEACNSFLKVGDKRNFKVRNYIINFCK